MARLVAPATAATRSYTISHRPPDSEGWLELLANGLTFDLAGLAPAAAGDVPAPVHHYGFETIAAPQGLEAITLRAGAHLAGGANLMPVVRSMVDVGLALACLPKVAALVWHPAGTMMAPAYFTRIAGKWLEGGPFPALGLTALARDADGTVRSEGLAFFTGQELRIEPARNGSPAQAAKIAVRLINHLVSINPLASPCEFTGPGGERLNAEPFGSGRFIRIWQQD